MRNPFTNYLRIRKNLISVPAAVVHRVSSDSATRSLSSVSHVFRSVEVSTLYFSPGCESQTRDNDWAWSVIERMIIGANSLLNNCRCSSKRFCGGFLALGFLAKNSAPAAWQALLASTNLPLPSTNNEFCRRALL